MIKQLKLITLFVLSLCVTISCSAQDHSVADQLIKGPIEITTEWKTITFDKPLQAAPYVQYLELLSCNNEYDFVKMAPDEERHFLGIRRFRRISDDKVVEPEVIANDGKNDYRLSYTISGSYFAGPAKDCRHIGYSLKGEGTAYYLSPEIKINSIKIRANVDMEIDHLYWVAPSYEKAPNATWETTHPSKIIDMRSQALSPNN